MSEPSQRNTPYFFPDISRNPFQEGDRIVKGLELNEKMIETRYSRYSILKHPSLPNSEIKIFPRTDEKPNSLFLNESRFILKHSNILKIESQCQGGFLSLKEAKLGVSYIVRELAPHGDLFEFLIKHSQKLNDRIIRTIFRQIIFTIEYLHDKGIAHLDLNPFNFLIGDDFNIKLTNFENALTTQEKVVITPMTKHYSAPEIRNKSCENILAADIYSAGILLFMLKTRGMNPHTDEKPIKEINFYDLLYNDEPEFWKEHCKLLNKDADFFDEDFKKLFRPMVEQDTNLRATLKEIKESKWFNGFHLTAQGFKKEMTSILSP